jgi:hypothetical protein
MATSVASCACCELDMHSRSETRVPGVSGAHGPTPEAAEVEAPSRRPEAQSICRQLRARARAPAETADATRHIQAIRGRRRAGGEATCCIRSELAKLDPSHTLHTAVLAYASF